MYRMSGPLVEVGGEEIGVPRLHAAVAQT